MSFDLKLLNDYQFGGVYQQAIFPNLLKFKFAIVCITWFGSQHLNSHN